MVIIIAANISNNLEETQTRHKTQALGCENQEESWRNIREECV